MVHAAWEQGRLSQMLCARFVSTVHQAVALVVLDFGFSCLLRWANTTCFCIILRIEGEDRDEGPGLVLSREQDPADVRCLLRLTETGQFSEYTAWETGQVGDEVGEALSGGKLVILETGIFHSWVNMQLFLLNHQNPQSWVNPALQNSARLHIQKPLVLYLFLFPSPHTILRDWEMFTSWGRETGGLPSPWGSQINDASSH